MALEPSSSPETIPLSSILENRKNPPKSSSSSSSSTRPKEPLDPLDEPLPPWNLPKLSPTDVFPPKSSSSSSSSTRPKEPLDPLDEPLPPWNLPKLSPTDVFKPDNVLLHALKLQTISNVEFAQGTSDITLNSEKTITMPLMSTSFQRSCLHKGISSIHLGMIQIGIAPCTRRALNTSVLACVLDSRVLDFQQALLTTVQANLEVGPISFAYYPNYGLSLHDPYLNQALKIRVRTSDAHAPREEHVVERVKLSIAWRVCFRVQVNDFRSPAVKRSSTAFDGVYLESSVGGKKTTTRTVDPTHVQIPKRWLQEQRTLIEDGSSSHQIA